MREKVRFPNFAVIFQHRDGSLDQQAKFISNRHNNLKGKKCYFHNKFRHLSYYGH